MNTTKALCETVMKLVMNKIIEQGEYYDEDDNGPCFELSPEAENYTRLVTESLDKLCELIDDDYKIYNVSDDVKT